MTTTRRNPDDAAMCRVEIKLMVRIGDDDMVEPVTVTEWRQIAADPSGYLADVVTPEVMGMAVKASGMLNAEAERIMWGADA